jgi:hypothetical protein
MFLGKEVVPLLKYGIFLIDATSKQILKRSKYVPYIVKL